MNKPMIADELWRRLEPLLSQAKARREKYPGRKPVPDRAALNGIAFVLHTALRWRDLPAEMGCGSGVTCWRRLRDWQEAGVWDRLHEVLLGKLRAAGQIDLSRVVVDSPSVRAIGAGTKTGHPVYRARPGSKHHVATDANGVPLSISLTGANRHDVTQLLPLIDAIPAIRSIRGRPLQMPQVVLADRGYDSESHRQKLLD
ncbi:transposase, partial [Robbsia andropogonis]